MIYISIHVIYYR